MIKVTDASNPAQTVTGPESITITAAAQTLTIASPPPATAGAPYTGTIPVTGGTGPYTCTVSAGTLPAGITLGANCTLTGTPTTPGTTTVTITATGTGTNGGTGTGPITITVGAPLSITTGSLTNGQVNVPYSSTIGVTGGTAPYTCTITSGTLQAGLALGPNCLVSGTPTVAGTVSLGVKATDSSSPTLTANGTVSLTITPAALGLSTGTLPAGTVGTPYSATIGVTGGTAPYTCAFTSGTLPAGLTLGANCLVSGTPTVAGSATLQVHATDSSNPVETANGPVGITINPAAPVLVISAPPAAIVNVPYTGTIPVTGGTGPYTCALAAGATLPAGLTLNANCTVTGTPTTAGSTPVTITATDSSNPPATKTGPVTITVNAPATTLTLSPPPVATVQTPYTGTIGVTGGTAPYTCTINAGTLPAGLTLGANCTITGTPTTAGAATITVTATGTGTNGGTVTGPVVVTVQPLPALTFTGSLPNATLGVAYTQTLTASGGLAPYTYTLTSGALPAGLTLSSTGVISGTPTAVGASSFTVTATDSETTPQTAPLPLVLLVVYPTTPNDAAFKGPYAFLFQGYDDVVAGVLAYQTATVGSFTADGTGVVSAGELDSNHQTSNPAGTTVASASFVGTYTIGTDNRGSLAITTLNADGTVGATHIYAIAIKAPVAPATVSAAATMIGFDGNQLVGTKGSGSILLQTPAAFSTGLTGSFAFGLSGDTNCLLTCTADLIGGPVASVGQFITGGAGLNGLITSGTGDENIASAHLPSSQLSGAYSAADGNGRVALTMATSGTPTEYPTNYAVYMVSATQAFVMSTDKHSAYLLLAGNAQQQTQAAFTNASITGPFVGYENAPTNPGLVGTTLSNVTNLSTATLFQAQGNGAGSCMTDIVTQGGTTALANGVTGLGSGVPVLNALLGTYASIGTSACTVATNGRAVLNYPAPSGLLVGTLGLLGLPDVPPPARVVYLSSPDEGFFLETGYAGLGHIDPQTSGQTGQPFTTATLKGTFLYGMAPAASLATIDTSGILTADGAGNITTTLDKNVGVGTLNVLDLGTTGTFPYTLVDPAFGVYQLTGTSIYIYAISPTRFVLLDTSATTTSPSVALLN